MAGLIKREDVDAVRERARIEDIIGAHVTLKPAGVGSLKGLCPFHDERTPSFNVRPATGRYKCFGCGEGGDVITFVEKIDGLSFAEAVEHLAAMVGVELRYEDSRTGALQAGQGQRGPDAGTRQRLFAANAAAADFYAAQLLTGEAALARKMLFDRSFDRADAERFGVGYAPNVDKGWDNLARYLQGKGFTQAELKAAGLVLDGKRPGSMYDRFRGRLIWPIRDTTGAVVGFGARRLYDDDQGPKYLNTPETPLYKKAKVLYGIDLAKKAIAATKRVVVVEGYTDVMAAHLSGIESAVATCGTAFGAEHARTVERFFHGDRSARLTFTFDGDSAGQAAAVHAYEVVRDLPLVLQAALVPGGMDPCDLRMAQGPQAVRALIDSAGSMASFVISATLTPFDLDTLEGRVGALAACAPLVTGISNDPLRKGLTDEIARRVGVDVADVQREVTRASSTPRRPVAAGASAGVASALGGVGAGGAGGFAGSGGLSGSATGLAGGGSPEAVGASAGGDDGSPAFALPRPNAREAVTRTEAMALAAVLQHPADVPSAFDTLPDDAFVNPVYRFIHAGVRGAGGVGAGQGMKTAAWVVAVLEAAQAAAVEAVTPVAGAAAAAQAGFQVAQMVDQLAVTPLPEDRAEQIPAVVAGVVTALREQELARRIADAKSRLQRLDATDFAAYQQATADLLALESARRALRLTET